MQTVMLRERPWFDGLAVEREAATKQRGFIPRWPFCEAKEQDAVCRQKAEPCFTEALRADKEMENGVIHKEMSETDQSKLVQGSPKFSTQGKFKSSSYDGWGQRVPFGSGNKGDCVSKIESINEC